MTHQTKRHDGIPDEDDVIKQADTMALLVFAVMIAMGAAVLILSAYLPSSVVQ